MKEVFKNYEIIVEPARTTDATCIFLKEISGWKNAQVLIYSNGARSIIYSTEENRMYTPSPSDRFWAHMVSVGFPKDVLERFNDIVETISENISFESSKRPSVNLISLMQSIDKSLETSANNLRELSKLIDSI